MKAQLKKHVKSIVGERVARKLGRVVRSITGGSMAMKPAEEIDPRVACQAMMHRPYDSVTAKAGVTRGESKDVSTGIQRIIAAYRASTGSTAVQATAIWESIANSQQAPLHQILIAGDPAAVDKLLSRPGDSELFYGIDNLISGAVRTFRERADIETGHAKLCQDHLIRLAELTGAGRFANPEFPGGNNAVAAQSTDQLIDAIEKAIGQQIDFPNPFPDEHGIKSRRGIVSYRAIHAIYQAWLIKALLRGVENPTVLEIGGGLGRTAYYTRRFGIADYTIVDLSFTAVSQAYFMMRTLGEDAVRLHGEPVGNDDAKVKLLNPDDFLNGSRRYDLIINVDSLTEMGRATAESYLTKICTSTPTFLSINHEANEFTVKALQDHARRLATRRREYGLRHGYVEELFEN